ncbi:MAG: inorganic phosphate transporter [Candidatus Algichlamydia australiensis]|nr:inorganic phosphate transporter [Chlamydiales bacterium]
MLTILVLAVGFYMAWNIGANDVANAMGTSVGSGALTLAKAVFIAGILEFCGAYFLGSSVSETMQRGIVDPQLFANDPKTFLFGMLAALLATAVWLQIASYFGWPVSTTHAIVGAILGFGAIVAGFHTVKWSVVGSIALSWVISPLISGIIAFLIFSLIQRNVLYAMKPFHAARVLIPYLLFFTFFTFSFSSLSDGIKNLNLHFTLLSTLFIALGIGLLAFLIGLIFLRGKKPPESHAEVPHLRYAYQATSLAKAAKHLGRVKLSSSGETRDELEQLHERVRAMRKELSEKSQTRSHSSEYTSVEKMFAYLQIISACFVAFAHGTNDVANAIGPVAAILEVVRTGGVAISGQIPSWLLAFGGFGIVVGLATWGWRVIETIGRKITELTPTRGFSAEFGAASTILIASKMGLPVSTTHCIVGAVLGVGLARGISALNLRMLRDIVLSWIVTLPSSALACIVFYYVIKALFTPLFS